MVHREWPVNWSIIVFFSLGEKQKAHRFFLANLQHNLKFSIFFY